MLKLKSMLGSFRLFLINMLYTLGGADLAVLDKAPSDRGEFRSRGIAAIVPAVLAFAGVTVAANIVIHSLPWALVVGFFGGVIMLLIDWSLLVGLVDAGWARRLLMLVVRGGASGLAAWAVASLLLLAIFSSDINTQVAKNNDLAAQAEFVQVVEPRYEADKAKAEATLKEDQVLLDAANATVKELTAKRNATDQRAACERTGTTVTLSCPKTSGKPGPGPNYEADKNQLRLDEQNLATAQNDAKKLQERLAPEMAAAQATLAKTSDGLAADKQAVLDRHRASNGLIVRWKAFSELRKQSREVNIEAWVIELLLMVIDMMAVIAAVFSRPTAYKRVLAAMHAKTDAEAAIKEANAQKARAQAELQARIDMAPQTIDAARADAEVAAVGHQNAIEEERHTRELAAQQAMTTKAVEVAVVETAARVEEIKASAAIKAAEVAARIAGIQNGAALAAAEIGAKIAHAQHEASGLRFSQIQMEQAIREIVADTNPVGPIQPSPAAGH